MLINRKLVQETKDILEANMSKAEMQGYSFIELALNETAPSGPKYMGVDEVRPIRQTNFRRNGMNAITPVKFIKGGVIEFYPDTHTGILYGYLLDSPSNRKWAVGMVASGKMVASDKDVMKEGNILRAKLPKAIDRNVEAYLNKGKPAVEVEEKNAKTEVLESKIEDLQALVHTLLANMAPKVEEPKVEIKKAATRKR